MKKKVSKLSSSITLRNKLTRNWDTTRLGIKLWRLLGTTESSSTTKQPPFSSLSSAFSLFAKGRL